MISFILWLLLAAISWPLALLALVLYPIVWIIALPFRLIGMSVSSVLELVKGIITFPARALGRAKS